MSLINKELNEFKLQAYQNEEFKTVTKEDLKGKWSVLFFYPADFTFVCPTELEDLQNNYAKFKKTVKVKKGYKTKKYPVKMTLSSHYEDGSLPGNGKAVLSVWSSQGLIGEKTVRI